MFGLQIAVGKKLFGSKKKKKKKIVYQNYGTFRVPDEYYFLPYSGKAKIIYDLANLIKTRVPPSSSDTANDTLE